MKGTNHPASHYALYSIPMLISPTSFQIFVRTPCCVCNIKGLYHLSQNYIVSYNVLPCSIVFRRTLATFCFPKFPQASFYTSVSFLFLLNLRSFISPTFLLSLLFLLLFYRPPATFSLQKKISFISLKGFPRYRG